MFYTILSLRGTKQSHEQNRQRLYNADQEMIGVFFMDKTIIFIIKTLLNVTLIPLYQKQHLDSFVYFNITKSMSINIRIGDRIRELRKVKGLSQEALANLAEVDRTYMTKVETGKKNVTVKILEKIIIALETDFGDFFNNNNFKK